MTRSNVDVLVAGGGFAGLTLAIALRQGLGPSFAVTVADPALGASRGEDERASAIVAAARRLFETIGVWEAVAADAQPILDMVVTDSKLGDAVRPTFLTFAGEVEPGEPFAHMIENRLLVDALAAKAREVGVALQPSAVATFTRDGDRVTAALADGSGIERPPPRRRRRRALDVFALRRASPPTAGITASPPSSSMSRTSAITKGRAEEHFLPAGPFAILPLKGRRSSIVWTETTAEAARIVALPDDAFHAELEQRFKLHLGDIKVIGARRVHPLGFFVARAFVADRIALVGDAAHVIHPIAGQGLNMGLKDVAALAEVIVDAARLGLDPGAADVLERYQRWRRFDTMAMGLATDGLNRLFSNRSDVLRAVRDVGLGLVDRLPGLKRLFIREAAGLVGEVPKLLRGETL